MIVCSNCGQQFENTNGYCPYCGTAVNLQNQQINQQQAQGYDPNAQQQAQGFDPNAYNNGYNNTNPNGYAPNGYDPNGYNPYGYQFNPQQPSGKLNVAQFVWSIINILMCCMPLGVASLIMTIVAQGAATLDEENKKLKTAKTLNLISTIGGGIIVIAYFVIIFAIAMTEGMSGGEVTF